MKKVYQIIYNFAGDDGIFYNTNILYLPDNYNKITIGNNNIKIEDRINISNCVPKYISYYDGYSEHYDFFDKEIFKIKIKETEYLKNLNYGEYILIIQFTYWNPNFKKYLIPSNKWKKIKKEMKIDYNLHFKNVNDLECICSYEKELYIEKLEKYYIGKYIPIDCISRKCFIENICFLMYDS